MMPIHDRHANRRRFLRSSAALGAAGLAAISALDQAAAFEEIPASSIIQPGDVILFQGDSITDAGRSRERAGMANDQAALGSGYAWMAAADVLVDLADDKLSIFNRGISGN